MYLSAGIRRSTFTPIKHGLPHQASNSMSNNDVFSPSLSHDIPSFYHPAQSLQIIATNVHVINLDFIPVPVILNSLSPFLPSSAFSTQRKEGTRTWNSLHLAIESTLYLLPHLYVFTEFFFVISYFLSSFVAFPFCPEFRR
ncbi:hypothetical protein H112_01516 [Trichophyton rubrum D6]|uniref:Uncharacterized protein n=3 Tax=Trichophyton TaxID=5550 RepID=A0A080WIV1_TRIRC|nr:uncharacterized protein TERG_12521 [Trichophyton rubrum CBS 118892]EZF26298.1 hypothetical protein H100_01511 [Trichophyton rubrum MR850]EZF45332.1 hypothetical protein H102_01507 [Trichophyton rubrum CBS 100081]EZF55995.1 hypothetical protein H103_01520 [Trichophyton rubrum CBS 288.86]EZF66580.1 hypothetical protein H104_01496 [Trichophyton rubrum CBS 289.86]EZF77189.1 hypothetical protein H105_01523 [Trichophyton soudanense CBS 452.61]EZF87878.1 hypothetical protein H110_01515 [Trichophy